MWMIFGIGAIVCLGFNLIFYMTKRRPDVFRFISLSLTALTVCAFYGQTKTWVIKEDWGALADVVPTTATMLWVLVILSILVNGITLIGKPKV